jgi:hypothetical protein
MKIRKLQYNIDYTHILTFREEYKDAVLPYFGFDKLRYAIENENTNSEWIRLIFTIEKIALFIRKDGISIVFEGDVNDLKNTTGVMKFFWDIYEKIKSFKGYKKTNRNSLIVHAVGILDAETSKERLQKCPYFAINPFGALEEYAAVYDFQSERENRKYKFYFGNYSDKDIKNHDLTPFQTEANEDLQSSLGVMCKLDIYEDSNSPTFSKFKSLLKDAEEIISSYDFNNV